MPEERAIGQAFVTGNGPVIGALAAGTTLDIATGIGDNEA